jgi:hypothetical protein
MDVYVVVLEDPYAANLVVCNQGSSSTFIEMHFEHDALCHYVTLCPKLIR